MAALRRGRRAEPWRGSVVLGGAPQEAWGGIAVSQLDPGCNFLDIRNRIIRGELNDRVVRSAPAKVLLEGIGLDRLEGIGPAAGRGRIESCACVDRSEGDAVGASP